MAQTFLKLRLAIPQPNLCVLPTFANRLNEIVAFMLVFSLHPSVFSDSLGSRETRRDARTCRSNSSRKNPRTFIHRIVESPESQEATITRALRGNVTGLKDRFTPDNNGCPLLSVVCARYRPSSITVSVRGTPQIGSSRPPITITASVTDRWENNNASNTMSSSNSRILKCSSRPACSGHRVRGNDRFGANK